MADTAPLTQTLQAEVDAVGAAADATVPVGEAPFAGTVSAVTYAATAAVTGANTNTRTLSLINKGQDGTGTTVVATLPLVSGTNLAANDEVTIPLSGTPANLNVAAGDVLAFASVHAGTGIADPGGLVKVQISRS
jgi:hypothetical protein